MTDKKLTVRTSSEIIKAIKVKCASEGITMQDYVISLVAKDLNLK